MSIHQRYAVVTAWTSADKTVGAGALVFVNAVGSADASTITIYNATTIKSVVAVATTSNVIVTFSIPAAYSNMIVDLTGTASYSIGYVPLT